jgi:hypothetical protein
MKTWELNSTGQLPEAVRSGRIRRKRLFPMRNLIDSRFPGRRLSGFRLLWKMGSGAVAFGREEARRGVRDNGRPPSPRGPILRLDPQASDESADYIKGWRT